MVVIYQISIVVPEFLNYLTLLNLLFYNKIEDRRNLAEEAGLQTCNIR